MSIFIQEVLGLLKRNQKKIILDKNKDWFEFGKLYQTSNLNTGAAYNPKMEPFVIKWGDIVCQVTEDMTRTLPGEGKLGYIPVYTDPSGFCSWDTLKDSIITQNALNTIITIGGNLVVTGDVQISGGDLTATTSTFNLLNTAPVSVINFGSTTTNIEVGGAATVFNVNGTAESTSCTTGALVIDGGVGIAKNLNLCGILSINNTTQSTSCTTGALVIAGGVGIAKDLFVCGNTTITGDAAINGGDLTTIASTFNLINTNATTVNFAGAATTLEIGAATGTTNINNNLDVDGDINIDGGDLTVSTSTFNLVNTTATTVNFAGAGTTVSIGAATGTTTINNANTVVAGDLAINGCDLTSTCATFNLLGQSSTINFGSAAPSILIGRADPTSTVTMVGTQESNACTNGALVVNGGVGIAKNLNVCGNLVVSGTAKLDGTIQDDTQNKVLVIDGSNIVRWRAASTIGSGSATITASNGLTMSTATNVILGGALGQNTTITSSGFSLTAANNTAVTAFTGQNLSSGKGILGTSVSGVGVTGTSETFRAGQFSISPLSDNTVAENTIFQRSVALNAPANDGIGQSLVFENAVKNGSLASANTLISKFTSTAVSARTSEFSITGVNAGVTGDKLILSGDGTLRLPDYGVGTKTGTAAFNLSISSTGNVIETPPINFAPQVYASMLTQAGSVDPPSTILIFNNINSGGSLVTFTWSRISAGLYELTCSSPIFSSKAAIFATPDIAPRPYFISLERILGDATKMRLNCFNPTTANSEDDLLDKATFKIELYD